MTNIKYKFARKSNKTGQRSRIAKLAYHDLEARRMLAAGMHHGVLVTDSQIITHHDTVPRFVADPTDIAISSGEWSSPQTWADGSVPTEQDLVRINDGVSVEFDSITAIDSIEILGDLVFSTDQDTSLLVTTITVLPTGTLAVGTAENPVEGSFSAEIVFRDSAIPTGTATAPGIDPFQYSRGLLVFGNFETNGADKTAYVRATQDLLRGDTAIELAAIPGDWQVGDEILLPKTAQDPIRKSPVEIDETETVIIKSISSQSIELESPIRFDHRGISDNPFDVSVFSHVGNLTRNVVLRSENPTGTRGHFMATGEATVAINDTKFLSMGRTRSDIHLDSSDIDPETGELHIGTNHIARYALHLHHMEHGFELVGNVVQDNLKWGIAVHDTNNGLVEGNIVYDTDGAGVMTEDGTETGNRFLDNLVVKVDGGIPDARGGVRKLVTHFGDVIVQTGTDGSGFWFRSGGSAGITEGNAVYDAAGYAYNFNGYYQTGFLGTVDSFSGNEAASSKGGLWLSWSQGSTVIGDNYQPQVLEDLLVWNSQEGIHAFHEGFFTVRDITIIGDAAVSSSNLGSSTQITARSSIGVLLANRSYENFNLTLENIRVSGQNIGYSQPTHAGDRGTILRDSVFANHVNLLFLESADQVKLTTENVTFLPSKVSRIAASFPGTVANRFAVDDGMIEEGDLSDTLPEPVVLPSSIEIRNGVLKIKGSTGNDVVSLDEAGEHLIITSQGNQTSVERSLVSSYLLFAGDGDDFFENRTNIEGLAIGGRGDDTLIGGSGIDTLRGGAGDDRIFGGFGDDVIYGDEGDDTIQGGAGEDKIRAGDGDDIVDGGAGNDPVISGSAGDDVLRGGLGDDIIVGDAGDDELFGDDGNDSVNGGIGSDLIHGNLGNDTLYGGEGDDFVYGDEGQDKIRGGLGADSLFYDFFDALLGSDEDDTVFLV